jgi:hypothetical protein
LKPKKEGKHIETNEPAVSISPGKEMIAAIRLSLVNP